MQFSDQSDITLVVTSCGRFDLLKRTLESFDLFNTADIREVFITEDSGDDAVRLAVPPHWHSHCTFLINRPKLGQLASVDLAYESVKTPTYSIARMIGRFIDQALSKTPRRYWSSDPIFCRCGCVTTFTTCRCTALISIWGHVR